MHLIRFFLRNNRVYIIFLLMVTFILLLHIVVRGNGIEDVEFYSMQATAYCLHGTTADGSQTRIGIAASKPEWIGKTAVVYLNDNGERGELLGFYEIKDTGGKSVRSGKVLDIWLPTYNECKQFGRKKVLVAIVDGVG